MKGSEFNLATPQEIAREIGARLRVQRLQQSLTQDELAARAAVSASALKTLEATGKSTIETLVRVAGALGLQADFAQLFSPKVVSSIADLERLERAQQRLRAPRGKSP
ncbi:helix-turn-helix domain-containing protein [Ideonella paludis]|uniref:Helix-turn-helix domain-containing protein n=1 Tax=Ideonella paludis TaxID=1233411 RepID=A0ABS5E373_9BURK|nr:helix-turn-helix domain-containing protein [Ideonella paludis]MBQ0937868.1 helix-turn-helix domain-containing protein [Ideonella paludis]